MNMPKKNMKNINDFLLKNDIPDKYIIKSPSMLSRIIEDNYDNGSLTKLSIIKNYAMTITTKQNRCPNSGIIKMNNSKYRLLTELECWRLQGFTDDDFYNALKANPNKSEKVTNGTLYKQAGNSIAIPILESLFQEIINQKFLEV